MPRSKTAVAVSAGLFGDDPCLAGDVHDREARAKEMEADALFTHRCLVTHALAALRRWSGDFGKYLQAEWGGAPPYGRAEIEDLLTLYRRRKKLAPDCLKRLHAAALAVFKVRHGRAQESCEEHMTVFAIELAILDRNPEDYPA